MKKALRRIFSLSFVLVLICAISIPTFAVTEIDTEESFPGFIMYAEATIEQYETEITLREYSTNKVRNISGDIECVYTYRWLISQDEDDYRIITETKSVSEYDNIYTSSRSFDAIRDNIYDMRHASYDIWVNVSTDSRTFEFAPDTLVVTYPH